MKTPEISKIKKLIRQSERVLIVETLKDCDGNISRAARDLGINRRTLQRKLKSMKVNR